MILGHKFGSGVEWSALNSIWRKGRLRSGAQEKCGAGSKQGRTGNRASCRVVLGYLSYLSKQLFQITQKSIIQRTAYFFNIIYYARITSFSVILVALAGFDREGEDREVCLSEIKSCQYHSRIGIHFGRWRDAFWSM